MQLIPPLYTSSKRGGPGTARPPTWGGPIAISLGGQITPLAHDYLRAAHEVGIPILDDLQDCETSNAAAFWHKYINRLTGRRSDAAHAYLHPVRKLQRNLHIQTNAKVSRVLFEGGKAVGIHMGTWSRPEEPHQVRKAHKDDIKYTKEDIQAIDDWVADHVETTCSVLL
ncbi:hypothetical protein JCM8097_009425, partial [Rhodosporidiobolus ruineniae]